jgi:hypothetical protein
MFTLSLLQILMAGRLPSVLCVRYTYLEVTQGLTRSRLDPGLARIQVCNKIV